MSSIRIIHGEGNCPKHGVYPYAARQVGKLLIGASCPECLAEAQSRAVAENQQIEIRTAQEKRFERLRNTGMPPAFYGVSFDDFKIINDRAGQNLRIVQTYGAMFEKALQSRPAPGMVFFGVPGTGKTHLGCALIKQLLESGYSATYASAPQFIMAVKDAAVSRDTTTTEMIARLARPSLLVLDEYGAHTRNDYDYQILFSVVDARYQKNLPTLLITNLTLKELEGEMDERFIERLRGPSGAMLAFDWPSQRVRHPSGTTAR